MSIIDTLITDRTQADVTKLKALLSKPKAMWTNEEWSEFLLAKDKGAYNATDLNRVQEAMEYLAERFRGYGYNVPEIKRPSITEVIPGTSRLPEGYTELEYIRSTGTEYVNTGVIPNQDTRLVIDVSLTDASTTNNVAGSRNTTTAQAFTIGTISGAWRTGYNNATTTSELVADTSRHIVDLNKNVFYVDGVVAYQSEYAQFVGYGNIYIGAINAQAKVYFGLAKYYSCQIYDNGTLVRDYVPCLNPSNEVGLYDTVNGVFYGNAGTGEFVPGFKLDENTLFYMNGSYLYDSSSNGMAVTNNGTSVSEARSKFGGKSLYFDGTSYLTVNVPVTGDVTLDCWVYQISFASDFPTPFNHLDGSYRGYYVHLTESKVYCDATNASGGMQSAQLASIPLGEWHHIAVIRSGTTVKFYVDGVLEATITNTHTTNDVLWLGIMPSAESLTPFNGYIDELRVSNVVRWTGEFTPPDEPYWKSSSPEAGTATITANRDYWKNGDIPHKEQMDQYLSNLGHVKNVLGLLKSTPESPSTMDNFTFSEANDIEQILVDIEFVITHTIQSMARLNAFMFVSGYRPFPSSASDYGRTWDDIDALDLNWDDLDDGEAWYTMQYGVIK